MNTANKLTMARVAMIPAFLVVMYLDIPNANYIALAIFILASLTDWLDGYVARHYNQITDFGKFMDPLADKCLVMAALCCLVEQGQMLGWILAVVLVREFAVSGMRMVAVEQGKVIAAGWSGKIKTAATMVCICLMLVIDLLPAPHSFNLLCQAIILGTTVYSGAEYFTKNISVFKGVK
ncbi:CDP-diacylglycerol--glycerol-3-phosphate 3-phosphatidyltransferase [Bengtsoniella intestinalis]|uniref:CDP-diacylglycerol--glycerol-3-phosphate 3-phosphatidyltransferase n=1 Tax=Bengtsoniella intestinalis TaxID=3073143 RepID=UPI00391F4D68